MKLRKMICMMMAVAMMLSLCAAVQAEGTVKIGMTGPMTGPAASYGISVRQGEQLAVDEINALGGIQLELNPQDDEADGEKAVNAYNTLMDWGMQMIAGAVTTGSCLAISTEAANDRVFMMTPSGSSPDIITGKDNVFQMCFTDPAQGVTDAKYIAENKLASKVAIIYNNGDTYSTGIYQAFEAEAKALGLEVVSVSTFTNDTTDFSVQVTDAKQKGAELVFLPIYYTPASMILKQAATIDYHPIFCGSDGMDGVLNIEGFDPALAEGVLLLTPFSANSPDEKTQAFVSAYQAAYNATPDQFAADGYDVVYAMYAAIQATGITADTPVEECCDKIIEFLKTYSHDGVTGVTSWDEEGAASKVPLAVIIKDGKYEKVN